MLNGQPFWNFLRVHTPHTYSVNSSPEKLLLVLGVQAEGWWSKDGTRNGMFVKATGIQIFWNIRFRTRNHQSLQLLLVVSVVGGEELEDIVTSNILSWLSFTHTNSFHFLWSISVFVGSLYVHLFVCFFFRKTDDDVYVLYEQQTLHFWAFQTETQFTSGMQ